MNQNITEIKVFVSLIFCLTSAYVHGNYECLCNNDIETTVFSGPSNSTLPLGFLYEFDCKPMDKSHSDATWAAILFEHQIGYVRQGASIAEQACSGSIPSRDVITPIQTLQTNATRKTATTKLLSTIRSTSHPLNQTTLQNTGKTTPGQTLGINSTTQTRRKSNVVNFTITSNFTQFQTTANNRTGVISTSAPIIFQKTTKPGNISNNTHSTLLNRTMSSVTGSNFTRMPYISNTGNTLANRNYTKPYSTAKYITHLTSKLNNSQGISTFGYWSNTTISRPLSSSVYTVSVSGINRLNRTSTQMVSPNTSFANHKTSSLNTILLTTPQITRKSVNHTFSHTAFWYTSIPTSNSSVSTSTSSMIQTSSQSLISTETPRHFPTSNQSLISTETPSSFPTSNQRLISTSTSGRIATLNQSVISTETSSPFPTLNHSLISTETPSPFATSNHSLISTETPSPFPTSNQTFIPTETPTPFPTSNHSLISPETSSPFPTSNPSLISTETPTPFPTSNHSLISTDTPSPFPTSNHSLISTETPSPFPTSNNSLIPTTKHHSVPNSNQSTSPLTEQSTKSTTNQSSHLSTEGQTTLSPQLSTTDKWIVELCPYYMLSKTIYNGTLDHPYPFVRTDGRYCYELSAGVDTWFNARATCREKSGDLVVIDKEGTEMMILTMLKELNYTGEVWIGLTNLNDIGKWRWVDGQGVAATYTNWDTSPYTDPESDIRRNCVTLDVTSGKWRTRACQTYVIDVPKHYAICQYEIPKR